MILEVRRMGEREKEEEQRSRKEILKLFEGNGDKKRKFRKFEWWF